MFIRVINFFVTLDLPRFEIILKNDFLTLKLTFIYFNSKRYGQMDVCHSN